MALNTSVQGSKGCKLHVWLTGYTSAQTKNPDGDKD